MTQSIPSVGHHLLLELFDCDKSVIDDVDRVRAGLLAAAAAVGAKPVAESWHRFSPQGVTAFLLIAESHLSCHTWPENGYVAMDVYTCGDLDPNAAIAAVSSAFGAKRCLSQDIVRGLLDFAPTESSHGDRALFDPRSFHAPVQRLTTAPESVRADPGCRPEVFRTNGIVDVTGLVSDDTFAAVRSETMRLLEPLRGVALVRGAGVSEHSRLVRDLYTSRELLAPLEAIAGERLFPCSDRDDALLVTQHCGRGDALDWHWGSGSYALVWIVEAPPLDCGGLLQCVPNTPCAPQKPDVLCHLVGNPIHTYYFRTGQLYLLRTDATLQRTIPLTKDVARITLSMTWVSKAALDRALDGDT
jgi:S-adenosylmethionine decarboxylase proenzyme